MARRSTRATLTRVGLVALAVALLALAAVAVRWSAIAGTGPGLTALVRLLRHGTTTVDDFRHYPARHLGASPSPSPLETADHAALGGLALESLGRASTLEELLDASRSTAFVVLRGRSVVGESYWRGGSADEPSQLFSVTKSITALLVGIAIDDGLVSPEASIVELVPELAGSGFDDATVVDLLAMRSGTDYVEDDNPFGVHVPFNYTTDTERMMLGFSAGSPTGEGFRYASGDAALASLVLARALAPETIAAFAEARLWLPLGAEHDAIWTLDRVGGLEKAWCCLATTARDLARVGRLVLEGGTLRGDRLVPATWIERMLAPAERGAPGWRDDYATAGLRGYGLAWWLLSEADGDAMALGKDGQFLYVNPRRDVVIVRLGRSIGGLTASEWAAALREVAVAVAPD